MVSDASVRRVGCIAVGVARCKGRVTRRPASQPELVVQQRIAARSGLGIHRADRSGLLLRNLARQTDALRRACRHPRRSTRRDAQYAVLRHGHLLEDQGSRGGSHRHTLVEKKRVDRLRPLSLRQP